MTRHAPSAILARFAKFVGQAMGLRYPEERIAELGRTMAALAREAGYADPDQYLSWLMSAPLSREQLDALAGALTIGETYFLRDPKSYHALTRQVLPELIARRRAADKTLRLWSAGCSSGEEPYTLAILLSRTIPDLATWNISLLATDINPRALERGRQGIYSRWSFRNAPHWLMEYFTSAERGRFAIVPRIREMVRFEHFNLAGEEPFPKAADGEPFDIIFCRNVLLYFELGQIERAVARFHQALRGGGWLFVGPTEVDRTLQKGFSCRSFDGAIALQKGCGDDKEACEPPDPPSPSLRGPARRPVPEPRRALPDATVSLPGKAEAAGLAPEPAGPAPTAPHAPPEGPAERDFAAEAAAHYRAGRYQRAAESVQRALEAGPQQAETVALGARALANLGRFDEAREFCEQAIALNRLNAQNHYLLSIILEHQGDTDGAAAALKNVLFIDHDYLLAYFALGNLFRQAGNLRESERNFGNALKLLERRDPREILPETEGMTAGGLAQMIQLMTKGGVDGKQ